MRLSLTIWLARRSRLAPNATRRASSGRLISPRTSSRFATFALAMIKTSPTAPNRTIIPAAHLRRRHRQAVSPRQRYLYRERQPGLRLELHRHVGERTRRLRNGDALQPRNHIQFVSNRFLKSGLPVSVTRASTVIHASTPRGYSTSGDITPTITNRSSPMVTRRPTTSAAPP